MLNLLVFLNILYILTDTVLNFYYCAMLITPAFRPRATLSVLGR